MNDISVQWRPAVRAAATHGARTVLLRLSASLARAACLSDGRPARGGPTRVAAGRPSWPFPIGEDGPLADAANLVVLRRVVDGEVTQHQDGSFLDDGYRTPTYLHGRILSMLALGMVGVVTIASDVRIVITVEGARLLDELEHAWQEIADRAA